MSETRQPPQPPRNPITETPRGAREARQTPESKGAEKPVQRATPLKDKILYGLGFETTSSKLQTLDATLEGLQRQKAAIEAYAQGWGTGLSRQNHSLDERQMSALDEQMAEVRNKIAALEAKQQGKKKK